MAEAIFKHKVAQLGLESKFGAIDSFGVSGWHEGDSPDHRSSRTCVKNGVPVNHRAQQITRADFAKFDYLFAMDQSHKSELLHMKPKGSDTVVELFGKWKTDDSLDTIVEDPYYSSTKSFEYNFKQLSHFTDVFLGEKFGK